MNKYILSLGVIMIIITGCSTKQNTNNDKKALTNLSYQDILLETSIHDAVRINDLKLIKFFIKEKGDLNHKDRFGYTPLHLAARFNHLDIAETLIKSGAQVNSIDKYKDSPLIDSTRNAYTKMSKLLICNGANRNVVDKYDMSPLHYAAKTNDVKIAKLLRSKNLKELCTKANIIVKKVINNPKIVKIQRPEIKLISIDDYNIINDNTPKICGDILSKNVKHVNLSFENIPNIYEAKILKNTNRWCVNIKDELSNGNYTAFAKAKDTKGNLQMKKDKFSIHIIANLYKALNDEFANDFKKWDAVLDKSTLTLKFKNPNLIFSRGSNKINNAYKNILKDFFPRYINIIKEYQNEIIDVYIEGHTSSRYRTAKTLEEKFSKNKKLSQNRANAVLKYLVNLKNIYIKDNQIFLNDTFIAKGKSSSNLIYNEDGSENVELSRRVEFRIKANPNK